MEEQHLSPTPAETPMPTPPAMPKKDHWMVEVAGGFALAMTILGGASTWYAVLATRILS
jgi:hypothetical protein